MADIYIDDVIASDFWMGVDARELVREIDAIRDDETITLHVHSPGGLIGDGVYIIDALRRHPGRIEAQIRGTAASMAAMIVVATADHVAIAKGGRIMLHRPVAGTVGDDIDHDETAQVLRGYLNDFADWLGRRMRSGQSEVLDLLEHGKEIWYTSAEAVSVGLADEETGALNSEGLSVQGRKFAAQYFRNPPPDLTHETAIFSLNQEGQRDADQFKDALGKLSETMRGASCQKPMT